jgi:alpha,alpha-trehalase
MYDGIDDLRTYIKNTWLELCRSSLVPAHDEKVTGTKYYLYIPECENLEDIKQKVLARNKDSGGPLPIVRYLPDDWSMIPADEHGALYVPNDFVVPGGRFNEMYGWDSFWIVKGLVRDGFVGLAKGMVEDQFYQIENYGGLVLNGTRTYYQRTHPPVTALMAVAVANVLAGKERKNFLVRAEVALSTNYEKFWKQKRFTPETGLFRYGHPEQAAFGLCPEVVHGERDAEGRTHYDRIIAMLEIMEDSELKNRLYDSENKTLTPYAVEGDWAMRESGFDPSMHLGFVGLETHDYNPVCLNSLLKMHCDVLASINKELGGPDIADTWQDEANRMKHTIRDKLRNEGGIYMALNTRTGFLSTFPFLTTAYPLMAGIVESEEEAKTLRNYIMEHFRTPHGLCAAESDDGTQWSKIWAPLNDFVCSGLRLCGFEKDAHEIEQGFFHAVLDGFKKFRAVFEKYDPVGKTGAVTDVAFGYEVNVKGFGWTNYFVAKTIDRLHASLEPALPEKRARWDAVSVCTLQAAA